LGERLLGAVADVLAPGLDPEREPVDARALELLEELVLHRVDARVRPDVEVVAALDDEVADPEDVALVEHEHLVEDLDIANLVFLDEKIDLLDRARGGAVTNARL